MKKKIYPMLFVAALSLSACTEVLEPNVDYGGTHSSTTIQRWSMQ